MAAELVWREQALDDIRAIIEYIAGDRPQAARHYVDSLGNACERLRDFPLSGRAYGPRYRVLVFRNHLAIYLFDATANTVFIARVLDGRRDIARILSLTDDPEQPNADEGSP